MKKTLSILILFMVSACTNSITANKISQDNYHGYYKIGEPYEIDGEWFYPREQSDYDETGIASWYGPDFHGKKTANGDTFDENALTAAHNTLPLPSMVRVTNLENNKTLVVMVNDRGPFAKGRVLDLSKRSAEILGFKNKGVAKIRVQFLEGHTKRLLADLPGRNDAEVTEKYSAKYDDKPDINLGTPLDIIPMDDGDVIASSVAAATIGSLKIPPSLSNKPQETAILAKNTNLSGFGDHDYSKSYMWSENLSESFDIGNVSNVDDLPDSDKIGKAPAIATKIATTSQTKIRHFIQAGTYGIENNAKRVEKILTSLGDVAISPVNVGKRTLYRVRLGPLKDKTMAKIALKKVIRMGHSDAMIINDKASVN